MHVSVCIRGSVPRCASVCADRCIIACWVFGCLAKGVSGCVRVCVCQGGCVCVSSAVLVLSVRGEGGEEHG